MSSKGSGLRNPPQDSVGIPGVHGGSAVAPRGMKGQDLHLGWVLPSRRVYSIPYVARVSHLELPSPWRQEEAGGGWKVVER